MHIDPASLWAKKNRQQHSFLSNMWHNLFLKPCMYYINSEIHEYNVLSNEEQHGPLLI